MNDTAREYGGGLFALALEENAADVILEETRAKGSSSAMPYINVCMMLNLCFVSSL